MLLKKTKNINNKQSTTLIPESYSSPLSSTTSASNWASKNALKSTVTPATTTTSHSSTVHLILMLVLLANSITTLTLACNVWSASDCMGAPTVAEEELMKSDDYTKEQLYKYCDKGKAYVDCINNKLKCCDLKPEMRASLQTQEKNLQKVAWKLGPYCAGLGESNVINYKCRTTTRATTTTSSKSTKPTMPPCPIEKVGYSLDLT